MTIKDARNRLVYLSKFRLDEEKTSSLLHRIKKKENPNEALLKGLKKLTEVTDEMEEYCKSLDFSSVSSPKHGGRGKDAKPRAPHKSKQRAREARKEEFESKWRHDGSPDSSWAEPFNM